MEIRPDRQPWQGSSSIYGIRRIFGTLKLRHKGPEETELKVRAYRVERLALQRPRNKGELAQKR